MTRLLAIVLAVIGFAAIPTTSLAKAPTPDQAMLTTLPDFAVAGTLRQAIERISQAAGVQIEVDWNALAAGGAKFDGNVKVAAPKATAGQLLDSALAQAAAKGNPLTWQIKGDVVRVTTQRHLLAANAADNYTPVGVRNSEKASDADKEKTSRSAITGQTVKEIRFENSPLADVLEMCRKASGVNMHVNWNALAVAGFAKDTPVSLQITDVPVSRIMDLVFSQLNTGKDKMQSIYWVVDDGIVLVSSGTALDQEMRTKIFDVADLLMVVPNFKGPVINVASAFNSTGTNNGSGSTNTGPFTTDSTSTANTSTLDADETNMAQARQAVRDTLISCVQDTIGKDMWDPQGKGTVRILGKQMIVSQSLLGYKLMEKATGR